MLASVIVNSSKQWIGQPLVYEVPASLIGEIRLGTWVRVPIGNRETDGVVVGFPQESTVQNVKVIGEVLDPELLPSPVVELLLWMSEYYLCLPGETLPLFLPPILKRRQCFWSWLGGKGREGLDPALFINPLTFEVAAYLSRRGRVTQRSLKSRWPGKELDLALQELEARGFVVREWSWGSKASKKQASSPGLEEENLRDIEQQVINLTFEQRLALKYLEIGLKQGKGNFLLHGITGSGKTEVYLRAVAAALNLGKGVIVLVPEHSLIPQMAERLKEAFGHLVVILHGDLPTGERTGVWEKLRSGEAKIVVGTRSALFAPLPELGLIVIDEEHSPTYKHEANPRYDAREVALKRGQLQGAVVVLGSATPSTEAYFLASRGQLKLLVLKQRVAGGQLPKVEIIDMREEYLQGRSGYLSVRLQEEIRTTLKRGEQVLLFLNRRGYAPHVTCRCCGYVPTCTNCAVGLTYHVDGKLRCHYCGLEKGWRGSCPRCGGSLALLGAGTQRVEAEIRTIFPEARVLRADSDSLKSPRRWREIYNLFLARQANVLIGTQTIAKGMDFPGVSLVGVINADVSLFLPDFRARERTFQLLTQVAGRAGRRSREGKVLIQTFNPQEPAIVLAARQDYESFYHLEIASRRTLRYPPFVKLARLGLMGLYEGEVISAAFSLARILKEVGTSLEVLGPAPAAIPKVRGEYRWQLTLKAPGWQELKEALEAGLGRYCCPPGIKLIKEIGPVNLW
ncbi:replication restart DNA helicase PriA [Thermanaeromonas toyohensis ToBE]|uniref:Replication restart protein PriA n=1 Tax=Thermanaeromonas toyohensis ToBE TaxID=698762 RepID=A0A1W1VNT1_9FIRM|nr:primosomal protein N' [Thermanaeromonas toyohensis]SMB94604.1 replication restart DNA helicase PriA [Thermanaeromonas toyohensis ToBE]